MRALLGWTLALSLAGCQASVVGMPDAAEAEPPYAPPPLTPAFPENPPPPLGAVEVKIPPAAAPAAGPPADAETSGAKLAPKSGEERNTLLGGERGLDHVGIATADLGAAKDAFLALGFSNPQDGVLPNGIQNVNFYFADGTYLELLTFYDRQKAPDIARFVERNRSGPMFAVLAVASAEDTAAFLRQRGFSVGKPRPGRIDPAGGSGKPTSSQPMWHTLMFDRPALPGDPLFFIAYDRAVRQELWRKLEDEKARRAFAHANTVEGLHAIWIAVRDLESARAAYARAGLSEVEAVTLPQLSARGVALAAGQGSVLLLAPQEGRGPVAEFLAQRGEGILGISLRVARLPRARAVVERGIAAKVMAYAGPFGPSLLLTPDRAAGTWLEFTVGPRQKSSGAGGS
jgi:catechol 2,3-dioxygenase-like lactoylglutathione lyase family enzyme